MLSEINNRVVASEQFGSGVCDANCRYCFIPKNEAMKEIHKEMKEWVRSGGYIETLKKMYGEDGRNFEYMGLWGTEPTLTMVELAGTMSELLGWAPNLKQISFSTNMLHHANNIPILAQAISDNIDKQKIKMSIQVSLDGPEWITDWNRQEGAVKNITKNLYKLITKLKEMKTNPNLTFLIKFKPTVSIENMVIINKDFDKLIEWYQIFDDVLAICQGLIGSDKRFILANGCSPTLVVPGEYTVADGEVFSIFTEKIHILERLNNKKNLFPHLTKNLCNYSLRFKKLLRYGNEHNINAHMFTCSGGDSNVGFSKKNIHLCHRSFFMENEAYLKAIKKNPTLDNWDTALLENGRLDITVNNYIAGIEDDLALAKMSASTRNYHDFYQLRIASTMALIYELAAANQASRIYMKNDLMREYLAFFLNQGMSCPAENILNSGNIHITPLSTIRIWANGAFEQLVKRYLEKEGIQRDI